MKSISKKSEMQKMDILINILRLKNINVLVLCLAVLFSPGTAFSQTEADSTEETENTSAETDKPTTKDQIKEKLKTLESELESTGISKDDSEDIAKGVLDAHEKGKIDLNKVKVKDGNIEINGGKVPVEQFADYVKSKGEAGESVVEAVGGFSETMVEFGGQLDELGFDDKDRSNLLKVVLDSKKRGLKDNQIKIKKDGSIAIKGRNFGSPELLENFYAKLPDNVNIGNLSLAQIKELDHKDIEFDFNNGALTASLGPISIDLVCFSRKCQEPSKGKGKKSTVPESTQEVIASSKPSEAYKLPTNKSSSSNPETAQGFRKPIVEQVASASSAGSAADPNEIANPSGAMGPDVRENLPQGGLETAASSVAAIRSESDVDPSENYGNGFIPVVQKSGTLSLPRSNAQKYPTFSYTKSLHANAKSDSNFRSIYQVNLGVHAEFLKREMPLFNSPEEIGKSFLSSEKHKNEYLAQFETPRAIAIMTLNYLDKTVAAGLATTEQQSQLRQVAHLLKQSNMHTAKLANPRWASLIDDTAEKFSQCMVGNNPLQVTSKRFKLQVAKCIEKDKEGNSVCPEINPDNLYEFCSCCADYTVAPNMATDVIEAKYTGTEDGTHSLVDQLFFGTVQSTNRAHTGSSSDEMLAEIAALAKEFKGFYGDHIITMNNDVDDSRNGLGQSQGVVSIVKPPAYTPAEVIAVYRNGCVGDEACTEEEESTAFCPTLYHLLENAGDDLGSDENRYEPVLTNSKGVKQYTNDEQELRAVRMNVIAKSGFALTQGNLRQVLSLGGLEPSDVYPGYDFVANGHKQIVSFMNQFCDAAARSYFASTHARMKDMVTDAIAMNSTLEGRQRAKILGLLTRVSSFIANQNISEDAAVKLRRLVQGVEVGESRKKAGNVAAASEAIERSTTNNSNKVSSGLSL